MFEPVTETDAKGAGSEAHAAAVSALMTTLRSGFLIPGSGLCVVTVTDRACSPLQWNTARNGI